MIYQESAGEAFGFAAAFDPFRDDVAFSLFGVDVSLSLGLLLFLFFFLVSPVGLGVLGFLGGLEPLGPTEPLSEEAAFDVADLGRQQTRSGEWTLAGTHKELC